MIIPNIRNAKLVSFSFTCFCLEKASWKPKGLSKLELKIIKTRHSRAEFWCKVVKRPDFRQIPKSRGRCWSSPWC